MGFKSINEIETFAFDDCEAVKIERTQNTLEMILEALIVLPKNSQNTNYTKSYAGTAHLVMNEAEVQQAFVEGYRKFDANDVLVEDVPDRAMSEEEIHLLFKTSEGAGLFLYQFEKVSGAGETPDEYVFWLERPVDDDPQGLESTIYRVHVICSQLSIAWEFYQNRVQE